MAEKIVVVMGVLDDASQELMSSWYSELRENGFTGTQTPGLPFHVSLATLPVECEQEALELVNKASSEFAPVDIHVSHLGSFAGGKVLFGAPDMNKELLDLHGFLMNGHEPPTAWVPHATVIMDEPDRISAEFPILQKSFRPFRAKITHLYLCAFWPTREVAMKELKGNPS